MLTIFALPKPFKEEFAIIQRNAIQSWLNLGNNVEVILFGDEEGTKEVAEELRTKHFPEIKRNELGTPLINDIFEKAQKIARNELLCYVNADIILMPDFIKAVDKVKNEENFLLVGQRWDFDLKEEINFGNNDWWQKLKEEVLKKGKLHPKTGIDYFLFKKGLFDNVPPFSLRTVWDEWLLYKAWRKEAKIIDATEFIMVVHQNHRYLTQNGQVFDPWKTKEAKINLKLAGGYGHCFTLEDATHILTKEGLIKKAPPMSLLRRLEIVPFLGFFVRQRRKLKRLLSWFK